MAKDSIRMQDLLDLPDPRVPVCLCLDTSGSMSFCDGGVDTGKRVVVEGRTCKVVTGGSKSRLQVLQQGIGEFYDAIYEDENARYAAEISVVTFNDVAQVLSDFSRVEYNNVRENPPVLTAGGATALGTGVNLALDRLEQRKAEYIKRGVDYFQPWLIIMTDGDNNRAPEDLAKAQERIQKLVKEKRLSVFPFILGNETGYDTLASLSPDQEPMRIGVTQMKGLFTWLGKSIAQVSSQSLGVDTTVKLREQDVISWDAPLD